MQDYRDWLEREDPLLDLAIPMVYLSNGNRNLLPGFLADIGSIETTADISIGLGTYLHTSSGGGVNETTTQLQAVYDAGFESATFYNYDSMFGNSLNNARRQAVVDWYDSLKLDGDFNGDGVVDAADYTCGKTRGSSLVTTSRRTPTAMGSSATTNTTSGATTTGRALPPRPECPSRRQPS